MLNELRQKWVSQSLLRQKWVSQSLRMYWDAQCTQAEMGFPVTEAVLGSSIYSGRNGFHSHRESIGMLNALRHNWVFQSLRPYWDAQFTQAEIGFTVTSVCDVHVVRQRWALRH